MKRNCPNFSCPQIKKSIIKDGHFRRASDSKTIQRFKCKTCGRRFSSSSNKLEIYQKKRRINVVLYRLLSSGVSMRRSALLLDVHRRTIKRKFQYLGRKSKIQNRKFLEKLMQNPVRHMQFDDLITKENSKLKPLSVSIAVDVNRRFILGAEVSQIPAFGHLAPVARKKYGLRLCHHKKGLKRLFKNLKGVVSPNAQICSDEHKKYQEFVSEFFPRSTYQQFKSERACVAGQGELKRVIFDPLFAINHTCAMLRGNINRLIRKTWCTTKDPARLKDHLEIFINFFNSQLILKNSNSTPFMCSS